MSRTWSSFCVVQFSQHLRPCFWLSAFSNGVKIEIQVSKLFRGRLREETGFIVVSNTKNQIQSRCRSHQAIQFWYKVVFIELYMKKLWFLYNRKRDHLTCRPHHHVGKTTQKTTIKCSRGYFCTVLGVKGVGCWVFEFKGKFGDNFRG